MKKDYADKEKLQELYYKFGTGKAVADFLGVPYKVLQRYLRRYGITNRIGGRRNINIEFFKDIDTEEKAYFLGFFTADGYVSKDLQRFQINLQEKDKYILERFSQISNCECNLTLRHPIVNGKEYIAYGLNISRRGFVEHMIQHGIVPGKENRKSIPDIKTHLIPHFLRGYFDADGFFSSSHNERINPIYTIGFCGRIDIINAIQYEFEKHNVYFSIYNSKHSPLIYTISASSHIMIQRIYHYLYDTSSIFLLRKKERISEAVKSFCPDVA